MKDIIIAYPNKEVALRLRALLVGEGFRVSHICALGSSALGAAGEKDAGVIICASLLRDMGAGTLAEQLPADFDVVALSKNGKTEYMGNLITGVHPAVDIPRGPIRHIVQKATDTQISKRYKSAAAMARALRPYVRL